MTFPSPIGELHFSIVLFATLGIFLWIVSVPYRGATFLNEQQALVGGKMFPRSFRPLSGSYISQWIWIHDGWINACFRPLSGSYISQLSCQLSHLQRKWTVSVPYRGATFLNKTWKSWEKNIRICFRPLSGSYISQYFWKWFLDIWQSRFRPLSGSYISQSLLIIYMFLIENVSVPYRGATFLNLVDEVNGNCYKVSVPYRGATFLNELLN